MGAPVPWKGDVHATRRGGGRFSIAPHTDDFAPNGEASGLYSVAVVTDGDDLVLVDTSTRAEYSRRHAPGYETAAPEEQEAHEEAFRAAGAPLMRGGRLL